LKKFYLLNGLSDHREWQSVKLSIIQQEIANKWDLTDLKRYLTDLEADMRALSAKSDSSNRHDTHNNTNNNRALTTQHNDNRGRGRGSRGRGGRSRGRGHFNNNNFNNNNNSNRGGRHSSDSSSSSNNNHHRGRGRSRGSYRGGHQSSSQQSTPYCNICTKQGHWSSQCHFNEDKDVECFNCHRMGHRSSNCRKRNNSNRQLHANSSVSSSSSSSTSSQNSNNNNNNNNNGYTFDDDDNNNNNNAPKRHRVFVTYTFSPSIALHTRTNKSSDWILDSGATDHYTGDLSLLRNLVRLAEPRNIATANFESTCTMTGSATIKFNESDTFTLTNVMYVPGFYFNLVSVSKLTDRDVGVTFLRNKADIIINNKIEYSIPRINNLYIFRPSTSSSSYSSLTSSSSSSSSPLINNESPSSSSSFDTSEVSIISTTPVITSPNTKLQRIVNSLYVMHIRYAHLNYAALIKMIINESVTSKYNPHKSLITHQNELLKILRAHPCEGCLKGKMHRSAMTRHISYHIDDKMDLWVFDTMIVSFHTLGGCRYITSVMDVYTTRVFIGLHKLKSDIASYFIKLVKRWQTQTEKTLKQLHHDNGTEICTEEVSEFLTSQGTIQTTSTTYTPQHNSLIERKHRSIIEMARSCVHHADAELKLYGDATKFAGHVLNVTINSHHHSMTPLERWDDRKPDTSHIHVWGCDVSYFLHKPHRDNKFSNKSELGIFLGYDEFNYIYFRILEVDTLVVHRIKDVKFHEDQFKEMQRLKEKMKNEHVNVDTNEKETNENFNSEITINDYLPDKLFKEKETVSSMFGDDAERIAMSEVSTNNNKENENNSHSNRDSTDGNNENENDSHSNRDSADGNNENENNRHSNRVSTSDHNRYSSHSNRDSTSDNNEKDAMNMELKETRRKELKDTQTDDLEDSHHNEIEQYSHENQKDVTNKKKKRKKIQTRNNTIENERETKNNVTIEIERKRSSRVTAIPDRLGMTSSSDPSSSSFSSHSSSSTHRLNTPFRMDPNDYAFLVLDEPISFQQAISCRERDKWLNAITDELNAHEKNGTWSVVKYTSDMNVIGCRWVFKVKRDANGKAVKWKGRLVAKGYKQQYGIDFHDTFAPVLKYKSLRIILVLSLHFNTHLEQLDVKTAFLNASVKEDIYISVPEGMSLKDGYVLKLNKALYGIKQAPREWHSEIDTFLKSLSYTACLKDSCLYWKKTNSSRIIIIGLFVDDITSSYHHDDRNEWLNDKQKLKSKYELSELGELNHILGMKITSSLSSNSTRKLIISQDSYIQDKLDLFNFDQCNTVTAPEIKSSSSTSTSSSSTRSLTENEVHTYKMMVGSLIYASISTRPDITHATNMVARSMSAPSLDNLTQVKRIFRYLSGSRSLGLLYSSPLSHNHQQAVEITGYCDSDWGGDKSDGKSTTGFCTKINGNLISWQTKKQPTVAQSSAEAEYMAINDVAKEIMWIRMILTELHVKIITPTIIYCDNQPAIRISKNDSDHDRTKHINIKHYYIKELINEGHIDLKWISTHHQLADIFTKGLAAPTFTTLRAQLMTHTN
jgi:hypothetical protein